MIIILGRAIKKEILQYLNTPQNQIQILFKNQIFFLKALWKITGDKKGGSNMSKNYFPPCKCKFVKKKYEKDATQYEKLQPSSPRHPSTKNKSPCAHFSWKQARLSAAEIGFFSAMALGLKTKPFIILPKK